MTSRGGDVEQCFGEVSNPMLTTSEPQIVSSSAILTPAPAPVSSLVTTKASLLPSENISSRRHTVATNLEGLKLELQKIHTPSVPSASLKSNIEQGLQAIFSLSSQTVTTPAHSNAYNHTHQLMSSSTPSLNTPTEVCQSFSVMTPPGQPVSSVSNLVTTGKLFILQISKEIFITKEII